MKRIDSTDPACPTEKKTSGHRHRIQTLSVALSLCLAALCHAGQRPNILLMVADDIGYEALGAYGGLDFETPGLDRMAARGMRFARAYTSPACTPCRVSLHTSLYTTEHRQTGTLPVHYGRNVAVDFGAMPTFAQLLRARGYQTSTTGKWQLATLSFHPNHIADAGFDSWCVWQIWSGTAKTKRYWNPYFNRDGAVLDDIAERFGPDVLEQYVWERMATARDANEPFLIVHNMLLPHEPITETPQDRELGRAASLGHMIEYLDHLVGRTLDKVEELGIRDNTYVFFIGDNGTEARHFNPRHTSAGDVHGGKRDLTDAGTHVPLLVWGPPGLGSGGVVSDLIDITDIFPTVCELTETAIPWTVSCRGISFVPQLQGRRGTPRVWVHHGYRNGVAVCDGQWRLDNSGALRDSRMLPAEPVATPGAEADAARTRLSALFDIGSYTLSLAKTGNGQVRVNGTLRSPPWSGSFTPGTSVSLEAVPDSTWVFSSWSGSLSGSANPTSITMTGDKSVTANFTQQPSATGIAPVEVKNSNNHNSLRSASNLFSVNGMDGTETYHYNLDGSLPGEPTSMDNVSWRTYGATDPATAASEGRIWIVIDLGASYPLGNLDIWNNQWDLNGTDYSKHGVSQFDVFVRDTEADTDDGTTGGTPINLHDGRTNNNVSDDPVFNLGTANQWQLALENQSLAQAPNSDTHTATTYNLNGNTARFIAIRVDSMHDPSGGARLGKVRVYEAPTPAAR